ncbi:MAG TPA: BON domain-containing protein [Planktothrix sp.]|jgi:osmotically-inducible protein OsmY
MSKLNKERPPSKNRQIEDKVINHLNNHEEIDTSRVEVKVHKAQATLKGKIDNNRAKDLAQTIVSGEVNEINDVINELDAERDISEELK